jgi:FdhD protein
VTLPDIPRPVTQVRTVKVRPDRHVELPDQVVTEEPMQIQMAGPGQEPQPLAVTMRTPGHDFELAAGFAVSEGVATPADITSVSYCDSPTDPQRDRYNTVTVRLARRWDPPEHARQFAASASCGLCGKATIDQLEVACPVIPPTPGAIPASLIPELPESLRGAQRVFERTGGLHAAGLFDPAGGLLCLREDVGRHNAVDKVIGHTVVDPHLHIALETCLIMVSGRVSFEIVQKSALAGIGTIAAVSAPSSLAVSAAERLGLTLIAFVRGTSFNLYTHPERIALDQ